MNFRLGITGGMGSGKSTVSKGFEVLGIPVFSADDKARDIMDSNENLKYELNKLVGFNVYNNGVLDRLGFARLIFNDEDLLGRVNALVHPFVIDAFSTWSEMQEAHYVAFEAAILFESGAYKNVDKVVAVIAPMEDRILRVIERNKFTREQVMERIKNQISENEMVRRADFIVNNADENMIIPQILSIHYTVMDMFNNKNNGEIC
ncbi:MAG: dephospho-CoA kinase [Bacteroidales bacterium]|nr:dephospho-CoA kinase [Bacteroidales bacterium]